MKILFILAVLFVSGCSSVVLMQNCVERGTDSDIFECEKL